MKAYTSGLIIKQNTQIEKERRLPIKGKILVNMGDYVNYDTIIAQGEIKGHLATFHFASELNINPQDIINHLIPKIGDKIQKNDIIGKTSSFFGLIKINIKSPFSGTLEYINKDTGTIGIRLDSEKINLIAYIKGIIKKIIPNEGAVIESNGTYIQGIFGIGGEKFGNLKITINSSNEKLEKIPDNCENTILVSGKSLELNTILEAEKKGVKGIITGSVSDKVIKDYIKKDLDIAITGNEKSKLTIIITEGFGDIQMSSKTFKILKSMDGSFISINGTTQIRAGVIRPEIIHINEKSKDIDKINETSLKIGSIVRIISEPYLCQYGKITKIFSQPIKIETGTKAYCVEIKLENETVIIPKTNIEIIY